MFFKKTALVVFGFFLALSSLEIFFQLITPKDLQGLVREFFGEQLTDCLRKDRLLNHILIPNCSGKIKTREYSIDFKTNSLGFRNEEVTNNKLKNTFRVLIVGDSFAEGWGVADEERFDTIAQNLANTTIPKKVEIINAGIRSYSPILELELLKTVGIKLNPDLVIMLFDVSDLHDDFYYGGWPRHLKIKNEIFPNQPDYIIMWPEDDSKLIKILKKSQLFSNLYHQVGTLILNHYKKLSAVNLGWDVSLFAKAEDWENFDKAWNLNIANIVLVNDFLKSKNIKSAVALVPRGIYISKTEWGAGRKSLGIDEGRIYEPKPLKIIEEGVGKYQIPIIDLLSQLSKSQESQLYYSFDGHWKRQAHKIVGEEIYKLIKEIVRND